MSKNDFSSLEFVISKAVVNVLRNSRISIIQPRRMTETDAAEYLGRSFYWLRNHRKSDDERVLKDGARKGPRYFREGKCPKDYREDLDDWLDDQKK